MCGIAGVLRPGQPAEAGEVVRMVAAQAHRGPDGNGVWAEGPIALGHNRLAIIDLETGRQPITNEDGTVWITFNGEIYNYRELREELFGLGHAFRTRSDTEVIVHAYEEWGAKCVDRLRGMFAFGIADTRNRTLFLARDPMGIKPLVYYEGPGCFAFSSEIRALKEARGIRLDIDLRSIDQYLAVQYIPAPASVYHQVKKLPPAHRMTVTWDGKVGVPERYWQLRYRPETSCSEAEWVEALDAVLRESVRAHLVADVPFGLFLSGGLDSGAVAAYMSETLGRPVKTFTIGFDEPEYDELRYAAEVVRRWGTEHHEETVRPDALGILPDLVRHYGEPFGDSSAIPTYYVSRLARRHVPMVLSGDGGDEAFLGYAAYSSWMRYLRGGDRFARRPAWKRLLWPVMSGLFPLRYPPLVPFGDGVLQWLALVEYLQGYWRRRLWRRELRSVASLPIEPYEEAFRMGASLGPAARVGQADLLTYLPGDILTKVDVASMMNGLEVRVPFVDRKVLEFAATIPESVNIKEGSSGEWSGKLLPKRLLERYYTSEFIHRAKMGFAVPIRSWFAGGGALREEVRERLLGKRSRLREYFEPGTVRELLRREAAGPLWLLVFLEEWLRQEDGRG